MKTASLVAVAVMAAALIGCASGGGKSNGPSNGSYNTSAGESSRFTNQRSTGRIVCYFFFICGEEYEEILPKPQTFRSWKEFKPGVTTYTDAWKGTADFGIGASGNVVDRYGYK